ncbi:sporulation related protein [Mucilaginibacter frigoritolerans]|uniref:Sporulation related protein n=1 Tax=Mucilaginibacter frigoritolerans TaxID=652788 RepID=A0A562UCB8_9SPHI|nr:SPOR domain-containing protein [Mucilaginibacter frigoritolerans]TWJ03452.1 sporulation related protein [Mucilaginibacter frigoritolerans]
MKAKISWISCSIFFVLFVLPALSHAQTRGKVEVVKDPLIDTLIARRASLSKGVGLGEETTSGYRVQIFFGSNRQDAYNAQARFSNEYPEIRTYVLYTEPNFKVQVGDFRTKLEAQKLQNDLRDKFTSLFIIPGKINPPKTDASND